MLPIITHYLLSIHSLPPTNEELSAKRVNYRHKKLQPRCLQCPESTRDSTNKKHVVPYYELYTHCVFSIFIELTLKLFMEVEFKTP